MSFAARTDERCGIWRCFILVVTSVFVVMAVDGRSIQAQESPALSSVERADAVAGQLNCPICDGYTLRDCPLPICGQMRDEIRGMLDSGSSDQEIIEHFIELHGPQVLNMPPARGAFLAAWIVPIFFVLGGALAVFRTLNGVRSTDSALPSNATTTGPASTESAVATTTESGEHAQVERLLAERDST